MTDGQIFFQTQPPSRNETVSVGTSSTVISEARNQENPRKVIVIRNLGSNNITVNFGQQQAVANAGVLIKAGESVVDCTDAGYEAHQGVITAIAATAATDVAILER